MLDQNTLEKRRANLREHGVPEKFIEKLATRQAMTSTYRLRMYVLPSLFLLPLVLLSPGVFKGLVSGLSPLIYGHPGPHLEFFAGVYFMFFILWMLACVVFVPMMGVVYLGLGRTDPFPAFSFTGSMLRGDPGMPAYPRLLPTGLDSLPDDLAFLKAVDARTKRFARLAFIFMSAGMGLAIVVLAILASQNYEVLTMDAYTVHEPFTPVRVYPLASAEGADVTCYDDKAHGGFQYELLFPGRTAFVSGTMGDDATRAQLVHHLMALDNRLRALHVPIERMPASGSAGDEGAACVAKWAAVNKSDPADIKALVWGD